jgi:restriction system protein
MQENFYNQISESINKGLIDGILFALVNFWYIWLLLLIVVIVKIIQRFYKIRKMNKAGLTEIDKMSGKDFEIFLEQLLRNHGYKVKRVGHMADYGGDLVIEKDNIKTVVQAKRWSNPVNVKAIQEINTAKAHYNATKAMVVTNNRFTSNASILAKENQVELVDRKKLALLILKK